MFYKNSICYFIKYSYFCTIKYNDDQMVIHELLL